MNCQDFDDFWNDRLDGRPAAPPGVALAVEAHAADCPACRAKRAGFLALSRAIEDLAPAAPPDGFAERCLAGLQNPRTGRWGSPAVWVPRVLTSLAAAACVAAAALVGLRTANPLPAPEVNVAPAPEETSLPDALASATSATWALALEASAPAARIGRDVLDSAVEAGAADEAAPSPVARGSASDVLESVGERVNERVRPLSGSAKRAFGFLLGPALGDGGDGPRPS
jgi:hypothetical protein